MKMEKTYYSISEVAKLLGIYEHTIRFWDSKLPNLSMRSEKGKTRFFNKKQIEKIEQINNLLKNHDSITLAFEIVSRKNYRGSDSSSPKIDNLSKNGSINLSQKSKIFSILKKIKQLTKN